MRDVKNKRNKIIKTAAGESIEHLIRESEKVFKSMPELSKRYMKMAWDLVKKNRVRLTHAQKIKFCRRCYSLWVPNETVTVFFDAKSNLFGYVCRCGYMRKGGVGSKGKNLKTGILSDNRL